MNFTLHTFGDLPDSLPCFFRLDAELVALHSPYFPDRPAALAGMKVLVLRLREFNAKSATSELFDTEPVLRPVTQEGWAEALQTAAMANRFPVEIVAWEAGEEQTEFDPRETNAWQAAGSTTLLMQENERRGYLPSVGLQANLASGPCDTIFNAFKPFVMADLPLFKGRKREVEEVIGQLRHQRLLLLYGEPRVGKSSLLRCGVAAKLAEVEEQLLVVEGEEFPIQDRLAATLRKELGDEAGEENKDVFTLLGQLTERIGHRLYLVFDHLEELFNPEIMDGERADFFQLVRRLQANEAEDCRVVLSVRENYLAPLVDYEAELPGLLHNRYRLLPMQAASMIDTTVNLLDVLSLRENLAVEDPRGVAEKAVAELTNERGEVSPNCLQIYLHQLHQKSCKNTDAGQAVPLSPSIMDRFGPARNLINDYLDERLGRLDSEQVAHQRAIDELEDSRRQCGCEKETVIAAVAPVPPAKAPPWWTLFLMSMLPLLPFAYWWFSAPEPPLPFCETVLEGDCDALLASYCAFGDTSECSLRLRERLDELNCPVWQDYQRVIDLDDCLSYRAFYAAREADGICLGKAAAELLARRCPLVRDTVTLRDTVRTEVRVPDPNFYGRLPATPVPAEGPPCEQFGTTTFKRIGPLWVATDALPGGPYAWEDALDACVARGWRLPCVGEIDYLIEKIYRNDPARAFAMLSGTSECYLVNPAETPGGRIEFWTATEANDASAWTFTFDVGAKTIQRQASTPKTARLPCLCVQKNPEVRGSALPPCYQKQIDRRAGK